MWLPGGRMALATAPNLGALLAVFDDARPARIAPRQGTVTITFDNRPDEAPLVVPPPGRVHGPMHGYIPFIGYLLWPGPVGLVLILIAASWSSISPASGEGRRRGEAPSSAALPAR